MARGLKFRIKIQEGLYYPCSENKGADQLCGYREADQRLCLLHMQNVGFLMTRLIYCCNTECSASIPVFYFLHKVFVCTKLLIKIMTLNCSATYQMQADLACL